MSNLNRKRKLDDLFIARMEDNEDILKRVMGMMTFAPLCMNPWPRRSSTGWVGECELQHRNARQRDRTRGRGC